MAPKIITLFPEHTCYVETHAGGAGVFFRKVPSTAEVLNDLNQEIVTFFDVLRERRADLIEAIECTPYSRVELQRATEPASDPLERARRFYIRSLQSFSNGEGERSLNWRFQINKDSLVNRWNKTSHLWACAQRLKAAQLECDTAANVIERFDDPNTLFYVDPPYVHDTRGESRIYRFEMTDDDHRALADQLKRVQGAVILSGYDSDLYRELYPDWRMVSFEMDTVQKTKRAECLWLSPRTKVREQRALF
jgi:DNA adenine methylase